MALTQADQVTLASSAAGAFIGAIAAFALEATRRWRSERSARYSSLLEAQFALCMQMDLMVKLQRDYLRPARDHPQRFMRLTPVIAPDPGLRVNFASLAFITAIDEVESIAKVYRAQQSFLTASQVLERRSRLVQEQFYSIDNPLKAFDFESGEGLVEHDPRQVRILKGMTDGLYKSVDDAVVMLGGAVDELAKVIKRHYPLRKVLSVDAPVSTEPASG